MDASTQTDPTDTSNAAIDTSGVSTRLKQMNHELAVLFAHVSDLHRRLERASVCLDQTNTIMEGHSRDLGSTLLQVHHRLQAVESYISHKSNPDEMLTPISEVSEWLNIDI